MNDMMRSLMFSLITFFLLLSVPLEATDLFYSNTEAESESGRYVVVATSPDNHPGGEERAFQKSFTYVCTDTRTGEKLWTRNQPMGEPQQIGDDPASTYTPQKEGSPASIRVSDSGYTIIYTGWQELIVIAPNGREVVKLDVLEDLLTEAENEEYVSQSSAGPMWSGRSHWYFLRDDGREFFVIRPWWGRRLIVEMATGRVSPRTESLVEATAEAEKSYVVDILQGVLDGVIKKCDSCGGPHEASFAAYLAGVLKIEEVVPALRKLEDHPYIGSSVMGGLAEVPEGRVYPFSYSVYTTRQNVHLSLRRLGEKPGPFPCTRFKTEHDDYDQKEPYVRKPVDGARHTNAGKIRKGMSPEQVINLVDCPDYIPRRIWQYDIDADEPYTLSVSWTEDRTVEKVEKIRPPLWKEGTIRDRE